MIRMGGTRVLGHHCLSMSESGDDRPCLLLPNRVGCFLCIWETIKGMSSAFISAGRMAGEKNAWERGRELECARG